MKLNKLLSFLFILLFFLPSCAYLDKYKTPTNQDVVLDPSLIQNYSAALLAQEKFKVPFISSYTYGDKNLIYVAAERVDGLGTLTHKTILKAMNELKPDFVILEGSAFTIVSDPDDIKYAKKCQKENFKYCSIDAYTISLALRSDTPFCYGEPSDAAIRATLKKSGVTDDELIVFYTISSGFKKNDEQKLKEALAHASKKVRAVKPMSAAHFKKIYKAKMGKVFTFSSETSPWFNKIAAAVEDMREQFLVKQIETRLNKYKNVLVVNGAAHLIKQRAMLLKALGSPVDMSAE